MPYGKLDWPPGCIDYAFNLVRPASLPSVEGLRATVFYTLLSRTLVFATLPDAERYRELVVRVLGGACGDIVTLDGRKIRGTGIVCGSSFAPTPLHLATYRFTQLPASAVRSCGSSSVRLVGYSARVLHVTAELACCSIPARTRTSRRSGACTRSSRHLQRCRAARRRCAPRRTSCTSTPRTTPRIWTASTRLWVRSRRTRCHARAPCCLHAVHVTCAAVHPTTDTSAARPAAPQLTPLHICCHLCGCTGCSCWALQHRTAHHR
jgi:hypothetical protein